MNELNECLNDYISQPESAYTNFYLAVAYQNLGHTAPAITYYLRAAERSEDNPVLTYRSLLRGFECYDSQGSRDSSSKIFLQHAITLCPTRPEAYFFLSRYHERRNEWQDSYLLAKTALAVCDFSNPEIDTPHFLPYGYFGKGSLLFEQAVAGYWWGKADESRKLFQVIVNEHWHDMDEQHQNCIQDNISRLGTGPESHAFIRYDKSMKPLIRSQFEGLDEIKENFSQVFQDMFVLCMLDGKKNGRYVEIGSATAFHGNNTALLERNFNWSGFGIEYDEKFIAEYTNNRRNPVIKADALTIDYAETFEDVFGKDVEVIDYLQLDIEPPKHTYEAMLRIPFDKYKFAVITFEHDHYADTTRSYRDLSRKFLRARGYVLVVNDISPDGDCSFEDWWVHPELVDPKILSKMTLIDYDKAHHAKYYMLTGASAISKRKSKYDQEIPQGFSDVDVVVKKKEINNFTINKGSKNTVWVVDDYYKTPDAVREFALNQQFVEGGLGRGFIGRRTANQFLFPGLKESFQEIMGKEITKWEEHGMNGRFQSCWGGEPLVYHCDEQTWAGMIYLTPNAPYQCGTTLHAHKQDGIRNSSHPNIMNVFHGHNLDGTYYEPVDVVGNVYNRLVIFDAHCIHSASEYFGHKLDNSRVWQMFFFD